MFAFVNQLKKPNMKKSNVLLLKSCAFLAFVFIAAIPAVAQTNSIYEVQSLFPQDAIIRYWQEEKYVVYSIDDNTMTHFTLFDYSSMQCTDFELKGIEVNDFEIESDVVYFCGNPAGVSNPYFGYFDIPTLFASGTGFHIVDLSSSGNSTQFSGHTERIVSLQKLEVQTCPDGVHVYMIGEATNTLLYTTNRCIVDMRYVAYSSQWFCSFAQENGSIYYDDDIAVTNNEVFVTGHKNGSSGHYVTAYPLPVFAANSLIPLSPYPSFYYCSGWGSDYQIDPYKPTMIEYLFDGYSAVVGYADVTIAGVNDRGTVISIYNGVSNCLYRYVIPQGFADTAKWEIKDLRYNAVTGRLYLLQEMSNPVAPYLNSVMCVFDIISSTGAIASASAYYDPDIKYFSLDQAESTWETVTVGKDIPMRLWHQNNAENCVINEPLPLVGLLIIADYWEYKQWPVNINLKTYLIDGILNYYGIESICE